MSDIEMTTGEVQEVAQTPDAGETEAKKSFDELIEGDYRREYGERVEAIVKHRLKDHAAAKEELGQLKNVMSELAAELGVAGDDPEAIVNAVRNRRDKGDAEAEEADSVTKEEGIKPMSLDPSVIEKVKGLAAGVKQTKEYYPDIDIAQELRDPEFIRLLSVCNNDVRRAYEMKYHDRILTNAMEYAVRMTESRLAENIQSRGARPSENAALGGSAVTVNSDPRSLTKAQRSEIKKRVRRGEKILW